MPFHLRLAPKPVVDLRYERIADGHLVEGVDHAVAVDVAVLDVTRAHGAEILLGPVGDVLFRLEQAFGDQAELLVVGKAGEVLVFPDLVGFVVVEFLVAVVGEVTACRYAEILVEAVVEFERHVETLVLHAAEVDPLRRFRADHRRGGFALDEDAFAFLIEIVRLDLDLVEQPQFDTDVGLRRLFPGNVRVAVLAGRIARAGWSVPGRRK